MNTSPTVYLIDDDPSVRKLIETSLSMHELPVQSFSNAESFLDSDWVDIAGCILLDYKMPGMNGLQMQKALLERNISIPVIFITAHADVPKSVEALKAGAFDFLEKPFSQEALVSTIKQAFAKDAELRSTRDLQEDYRKRFEKLTEREFEIMQMLISGSANHSSKTIAKELNISPRTIEHHRMRILEKTEAHSVAELVKFASIAGYQI